MTFSPEIQRWLDKNRGCDFASLMLKAGGDSARKAAVVQTEARRRARTKLPILAQNEAVLFPSILAVEQSTSELLASYHASLVASGKSVVDLTAGLGADALAFASKAQSVTAIEKNGELVDALRHNLSVLGVSNVSVVEDDSMAWLKAHDANFDVAFIDPYRRDDSGGKVVSFADCTPDVAANLQLIIEHADKLIIKASPMHDVALAVNELGSAVKSVIITGTRRECKELLLIIEKGWSGAKEMNCVTLSTDGVVDSFSWQYGEKVVNNNYSFPKAGDWVYELWPAVMKGGAYGLIAERTGTDLLSPFTHVYTSENFVSNFPGRAMMVEHVYPFNKQSLKQIKSSYSHLNVAVRNFPVSAPELEKRLGTKPGGEYRLLGVTDLNRNPFLLLLKEA